MSSEYRLHDGHPALQQAFDAILKDGLYAVRRGFEHFAEKDLLAVFGSLLLLLGFQLFERCPKKRLAKRINRILRIYTAITDLLPRPATAYIFFQLGLMDNQVKTVEEIVSDQSLIDLVNYWTASAAPLGESWRVIPGHAVDNDPIPFVIANDEGLAALTAERDQPIIPDINIAQPFSSGRPKIHLVSDGPIVEAGARVAIPPDTIVLKPIKH